MKGLLQEFASKAYLLGLHTEFNDDEFGSLLRFATPRDLFIIEDHSDVDNAAAVFLILDAIEAKGYPTTLFAYKDANGLPTGDHGLNIEHPSSLNNTRLAAYGHAPARTEAVVKAALELCKHLEATQGVRGLGRVV